MRLSLPEISWETGVVCANHSRVDFSFKGGYFIFVAPRLNQSMMQMSICKGSKLESEQTDAWHLPPTPLLQMKPPPYQPLPTCGYLIKAGNLEQGWGVEYFFGTAIYSWIRPPSSLQKALSVLSLENRKCPSKASRWPYEAQGSYVLPSQASEGLSSLNTSEEGC